MPQQISMQRLRRRSLFIATPMYDGLANNNYIASVNYLTRLLTQYQITHMIHYIGNESLIQRARNYCLPADAEVETEFGVKTIKELCEEKYRGKVWSLDKDGKMVLRNVIGWSIRPNLENKKWVQLVPKSGTRTKKRLNCTADHEVCVIDDVLNPIPYFIQAQFSPGRHLVRMANTEVGNRSRENKLYNSDQLSAIIGMCLGDASISKEGAFVVGHGIAQKEYSEHVAELLNGTFTERESPTSFDKEGETTYVATVTASTNEQTKKLRDLLYVDGKKTPINVMDMINPIALAYWYMDDGHLVQVKNRSPFIRLCTQGFTEDENMELLQMLNDKFGITGHVKKSHYGTKFYIELHVEGSKKFFNLVAPHMIDTMRYKLPVSYHEIDYTNLNNEPLDYSTMLIGECRHLNRDDNLYDITVTDTHNFIANHSVVHNCAEEFMRSGMSHMLFIDADIGFSPESVLDMLALMDPHSEYQIMTAPYPKKTITWEKVKAAVNKGLADDKAASLSDFVGDFVLNMPPGQAEIRLNEPFPVLEAGTGFMMVQRRAFELFAERFPAAYYYPDHARTPGFDGSKEIAAFFHCEIDRGHPEYDWIQLVREAAEGKDIRKKAKEFVDKEKKATRRYLSEDYFFCQRARAAGVTIWMCPWIKLNHAGRYIFDGSLVKMLQAGMSPTYDEELFQ